MSEEEKKAIELINLLYTDNLTQFGKRQLADMIEKQQTKIKLLNDTINEYKERMDKARRILEE